MLYAIGDPFPPVEAPQDTLIWLEETAEAEIPVGVVGGGITTGAHLPVPLVVFLQ